MNEGDFQLISILKGKRIKLTLKASSYFGVIQRINPNKTLILSDGQIKCEPRVSFGSSLARLELMITVSVDKSIWGPRKVRRR